MRWALGVQAALVAGVVVEVTSSPTGTLAFVLDTVVYNAALFLAAAITLARAALGTSDRLAWACIGAAIGVWATGNLLWSLVLASLESPPYPSVADGFWLAFYPLAYLGGGLLVRSRVGAFAGHVWLDGAIAALVVTGVAVSFVVDPVVRATDGAPAAVATNLAYPLADTILLALLVVMGARIHRDRVWAALAGGLAIFAIADSIYLYEVATGSYAVGNVVDVGWVVAVTLVAVAAWMHPGPRATTSLEGWRLVVTPAVFGVVAIAVEVYDHFDRVPVVALALVSAALVLVLVRLALTFGDHLTLLRQVRRDAVTDSLTSLGNRRALVGDLEETCASGGEAVLALFDLNAFKRYNDLFGHLAGDTLLARLGGKLQQALRGRGAAYRLGGDEFCVLLRDQGDSADAIVARAAAALQDAGSRFDVTASWGIARLPIEAETPSQALSLADRRMYERKHAGRAAADPTAQRALLTALGERDPRLHDHAGGVVNLAVAVGRRLGFGAAELADLRVAAELHDVGKVAIPDAILFKPGPLDADEWAFMRRHTLIGERIVASVPALDHVARFVRSSHEQWDGSGYPDGLAGDAIPLVSRVVAVCDAYDAMTTDRPYRSAATAEAALRELRACAGTQFDPQVVDVLPHALADVAAEQEQEQEQDVRPAVGL